MEAALALAGHTTLPTLVEEETEAKEAEAKEPTDTKETDAKEATTPETPVRKGRGRKPAAKATKVQSPSLNVIAEEATEPSKPAAARGKRKVVEEDGVEDVPTPPAKRVSRRVTITTLDTDIEARTPIGPPPV